ncbi:MAG: beta-N-acetylhexosaminidase [Pseudomonadales bacterium]|nr:beta-N-acetylhexosaminidase [Pseudomonadales bacterium]
MVDLLPMPTSIQSGDGCLRRSKENVSSEQVRAPGRVLRAVARLSLAGFPIEVEIGETTAEQPRLGDSYAYRLDVSETRVRIEADTQWGALAALTTLTQLTHDDLIPCCAISDAPRFQWRGLMVDVARHYISLETLRRTLDAMGYFKLNVLHIHLSDDQAFRYSGTLFPEMASAEHYTASDLAALVAYAADRGVRIVPELDVPGHTTSWLVTHPEWGAGGEVSASSAFGPHETVLDPTGSELMDALGHIFGEIAEVFPDPYVHFGGDEVRSNEWQGSAAIQDYMRTQKIDDVNGLQADFNRRLVSMLGGLGKKPVGWDEILHPNLPDNVVIQCWRGMFGRDEALQAGYDCVISAPYYLDLFMPAGVHYRYDPEETKADLARIDEQLRNDSRFAHVVGDIGWGKGFTDYPKLETAKKGRVLGAEACIWTELVSDELFDRRVWSRMPAIAERFWSDREVRDEGDMYRRLELHHARLEQHCGVDAVTDRDMLRVLGLEPLIDMLEPVKGYTRVLGEELSTARGQGRDVTQIKRPYTADTLLDRVIDRIGPESTATRRFVSALEVGEDTTGWTSGWREQHRILMGLLSQRPELAELEEASRALAELADIVDAGGEVSPALAGPYGEYLLPAVFAVSAHDS